MVKNLPGNAGNANSVPPRGTKTPHAEGQSNSTAEPSR